MEKFFLIQARMDWGYFFFPQRDLKSDSLQLPPYCQQEGHPVSKPEQWGRLTEYPDSFETGNKVILYQSGNPRWLRGIWGYGTILKTDKVVKVHYDRLLKFPLLIPKEERDKLESMFLRKLVSIEHRKPHQATYANIKKEEFQRLTRLIQTREGYRPPSVAHKTRREPPKLACTKAKTAFEKWTLKEGWGLISTGFPDFLAMFPNGGLIAFEAKSGAGTLRPNQAEVARILCENDIEVAEIHDLSQDQVKKEIEGSGLEILAQADSPRGGTRGWPDYILVKRKTQVMCELKSNSAPLSPYQIRTLSALISRGLKVHVVRAVRKGRKWWLYDDTERWLLYPA